MGIINWIQSRFLGKTENRIFDGATAISSYRGGTHQIVHLESEKHLNTEPWPMSGLLSIGTLGSQEPRPAAHEQEQDLPEFTFTVEEVKQLQDAVAMLLWRASSRGSGASEDRPPLDRFLNCPSCLEVDRMVQTTTTTTTEQGECDVRNGDLSPDTKIILTRARDLLDSSGGGIKQRLFKLLLKKMFACNGGFSSPPSRSLKDPVESKMEKFIRTMLGKKVNASCSGNGSATSRKYFLEDGTRGKRRGGHRRCGCLGEEEGEEEEEKEREDSCRWDRTDSEFIVLEI